jgi:hypothetical protein
LVPAGLAGVKTLVGTKAVASNGRIWWGAKFKVKSRRQTWPRVKQTPAKRRRWCLG